jgi:hypothetical protein
LRTPRTGPSASKSTCKRSRIRASNNRYRWEAARSLFGGWTEESSTSLPPTGS